MAGHVDLYGYLGINEEGQLQLYVSAQRLNVIGTRLEKGSRFPHIVYNFTEDPSKETAVLALMGVQDYFDGKDQRAGLVFGEKSGKEREGNDRDTR